MPILRIRDENGNFIPIYAIRGDDGKSAYEQAKEGGYKGTEEEFVARLNDLTGSENLARFQTGSYVGTGTAGINNKNTLTFNFEPKFVFITNKLNWSYRMHPFVRGCDVGVMQCGADMYTVELSWNGNTLSWYNGDGSDWKQFNSRITYHYIAIG